MLQQRPVFGNTILDALPISEIERLEPALHRVFLHRKQVLGRPNEPVRHLHFPVDAFCWSWAQSDNNRPTSILTVGRRGVLELDRALGLKRGRSCMTVISPGAAWRLSMETFDLEESINAPLRKLVTRYAYSCVMNNARRLACDSEHNVVQRVARWLLWVADESAKNEFSITHEQIAQITSIRRPSVSLALSQFQRDTILRSRHGRLRILNRESLESHVCRCYWIIQPDADGVEQTMDLMI